MFFWYLRYCQLVFGSDALLGKNISGFLLLFPYYNEFLIVTANNAR